MRFLHIADLHFGKIMNEIPLAEADQPYWIEQFMKTVDAVKPDAVVIAGDVYDRSSPSADAVALLDRLLTELSEKSINVIMTSGNHDSGQKLGYASEILKRNNIYIAGVIPSETGEIPHVKLKDEYGDVVFWIMPYIFPSLVNDILKSEYRDYESACRALIEHQNIDWSVRNVMVAHQNVTRSGAEAERSGSESMVAGVGGIDYTVFENFEYTALGHIHAAQYVGLSKIRYAGSPLCYHFDEAKYSVKGPVLVELGEKGTETSAEIIPVEPLHRVRVLKGTYDDIVNELLAEPSGHDYLKAVITDRKVTPDISENLRDIALSKESLMLEINSTFGDDARISGTMKPGDFSASVSLSDLFADFYSLQRNDVQPDEKDTAVIELIQEFMDIKDTEEIAGMIIDLAMEQEEKS